jgi:hypothetical protein
VLSANPATGILVTTGGPPPSKYGAVTLAYLRAAQAYMLISMPTETSTIFGVFQAIPGLLANGRHFVVLRNRIGWHLG